MSAKVIKPAQPRTPHGFTRQRASGPMGAVVLLGTVGLALSGGLQAIAIAYAFALLVVICGLAVAVPVIVVWSFIEEGMRS